MRAVCRAKAELDQERTSRLDSEDAAAQLREQLQKARKEQEKAEKTASKELEKLQNKFDRLQVFTTQTWRQ